MEAIRERQQVGGGGGGGGGRKGGREGGRERGRELANLRHKYELLCVCVCWFI